MTGVESVPETEGIAASKLSGTTTKELVQLAESEMAILPSEVITKALPEADATKPRISSGCRLGAITAGSTVAPVAVNQRCRFVALAREATKR